MFEYNTIAWYTRISYIIYNMPRNNASFCRTMFWGYSRLCHGRMDMHGMFIPGFIRISAGWYLSLQELVILALDWATELWTPANHLPHGWYQVMLRYREIFHTFRWHACTWVLIKWHTSWKRMVLAPHLGGAAHDGITFRNLAAHASRGDMHMGIRKNDHIRRHQSWRSHSDN
jgi:hypothetical protein